MSQNLLGVRDLLMQFQGLTALDRVSFDVAAGSITSLMGPNGAGKTTLFNCVTGMYTPTGGQVHFDGQDITARAAHVVARHGIARTFQNLALFGGLSVIDNLLVGTYLQGRSGVLQGAFMSPQARREKREGLEAAYTVLGSGGGAAAVAPDAGALPGRHIKRSIRAGRRFKIADIATDDAYYADRATMIGKICTAGEQSTFRDPEWHGGQVSCDDGSSYYFYKAAYAPLGADAD